MHFNQTTGYGYNDIGRDTIEKVYSEIIADAKEKAHNFIYLNKNDLILITGGFPNNIEEKTTNFMKIEKI